MAGMTDRMRWDREGVDWPNRDASRFIGAGGIDWHVQVMGSGPPALLIHGTGATTHSWRDLAPMLARHFTVIAPDLPGHGFTSRPPDGRLSLPAMSHGLDYLLEALGLRPDIAIGHSAGAAVVLRMALDHRIDAKAIISLSGALTPYPGSGAFGYQTFVRAFFLNPITPRVFSRMARDRRAVERVLTGTGSHLDTAGLDYYRRCFSDHRHVAGTLSMMANWDLKPLLHDLPRLRAALTLIAPTRDYAVPPQVAREIKTTLPGARLVPVEGLGHLAHEEAPALTERLILDAAEQAGVLAFPEEAVEA